MSCSSGSKPLRWPSSSYPSDSWQPPRWGVGLTEAISHHLKRARREANHRSRICCFDFCIGHSFAACFCLDFSMPLLLMMKHIVLIKAPTICLCYLASRLAVTLLRAQSRFCWGWIQWESSHPLSKLEHHQKELAVLKEWWRILGVASQCYLRCF
jgi:hypothetical protein